MVTASKQPTRPLDQFISKVINKPQVFFASDQSVAKQALDITRHFYDSAKQYESTPLSPFPTLLTDGFDNDQIWEEITLQNEPFFALARQTLKSINSRKAQQEDQDEDEEELVDEDMDEYDVSEDSNEEALLSMEEDNVVEDVEDEELHDSLDELEQGTEDELDQDEDNEDTRPSKQSEVDDEFFNLDSFNKWTEEQEELDMKSDREDEEDSEEEDLEESGDDGDLGDEDILYSNFFDQPQQSHRGRFSRVRFDDEQHDDRFHADDDEEEQEGDDRENDRQMETDSDAEPRVKDLFAAEEAEEDKDDKTAHEKQVERLQAQIEKFEEENIGDRHWTLRGEATSKARPMNSLLEEGLDFEYSTKPVPVITHETTFALEDVIKNRISESQYDDVERKEDPAFRPFLPSKRVELNEDKSKLSLAEVYEQDYVKEASGDTTNAKDKALEKEHDVISGMFTSLCEKLDSLSNFYYTPKTPKPEITIISNAAAISMEETIPLHVSDATRLAPEEVYDKKVGEVKSTSEMDQDERKRARAVKKKVKRKEREIKEKEIKVLEKMRPGLGHKQAKVKAVKELSGKKNVTIIGSK